MAFGGVIKLQGESELGIGIEHAFNKIKDKYVDITAELVLGKDVTKEDYISIIEIKDEKVLKYCQKYQEYMALVPYELMK